LLQMTMMSNLVDCSPQFWPVSPGIPQPSPSLLWPPNQLAVRQVISVSLLTQLNNLAQNFATSMRNYEAILFNGLSRNDLISKVQRSLGIGGNELPLTSWQPSNKVHPIECSKVCSVISAYRLWDVMAMLDGSQPAPTIERCFLEVSYATFRVSVNTQSFTSSQKPAGDG
jgi:hypothetical protein